MFSTILEDAIAIAVSLDAINQEMGVIRNIFLVAIPGVLLLVAGGAWAIAGSSLYPIRRLTRAIGNVTASVRDRHVVEKPPMRQCQRV